MNVHPGFPHRPGQQPCNQIARTAVEQLARVHLPKPDETSQPGAAQTNRVSDELQRLRRTVRRLRRHCREAFYSMHVRMDRIEREGRS